MEKLRKIRKPGAKRGDVNRVKSGIGLSEYTISGTQAEEPGQESVHGDDGAAITSRTARVLLAGAGFLADAVSAPRKEAFLLQKKETPPRTHSN